MLVAMRLYMAAVEAVRGVDAGRLDVGSLVAGKYRIERLVGRGAMGVVYEARHELLDRRVALKFISEEHVGSTEVARRFLNEALPSACASESHARSTSVEGGR